MSPSDADTPTDGARRTISRMSLIEIGMLRKALASKNNQLLINVDLLVRVFFA